MTDYWTSLFPRLYFLLLEHSCEGFETTRFVCGRFNNLGPIYTVVWADISLPLKLIPVINSFSWNLEQLKGFQANITRLKSERESQKRVRESARERVSRTEI